MNKKMLGVICTDSHVLSDWSPLLQAKAQDLGWAFGCADQSANYRADQIDCVLVTMDPYEVLAADLVVILAMPQRSYDNFATSEMKTSIERDSFRLMQISMFALDRAITMDATSPLLDFPGLGIVSNASRHVVKAGLSPLALYDEIPPSSEASAIWPASLMRFPHGDSADGGSAAMDLTGRARVLAHGPYVTLFPGAWTVSYTVMIDPEGGVANLLFEWGGSEMVKYHAEIKTPGIYRCQQTQIWTSSEPAQLRISMERALFQGRFELQDIAVQRIGEV